MDEIVLDIGCKQIMVHQELIVSLKVMWQPLDVPWRYSIIPTG